MENIELIANVSGRDVELDCMDAITQITENLKEMNGLSEEAVFRIAAWYFQKYSKPSNMNLMVD